MENPSPEKEALARLEQENRQLRDQVEQLVRAVPKPTSSSQGCFGVVGVGVVSIVVGIIVWWLLYQYPPWIKAKSQYQQVLYWSKWVKDHETQFVGYDHINSVAKQQVIKPAIRASGQLFDVTEYRIFWPLLWIEWAVLCGLIGSCFHYMARNRSNHEKGSEPTV
ncbi:MAG TPA: hypothetical protein PLX97_07385 [Gemmatales bacterium]|nr:hypothetical protein [Gemmatales bacterium]